MLPYLDDSAAFPDCETALIEPDGLLCFGADLSTERLMQAYARGIFPWYTKNEPIMWWSPANRMVLFPEQLHLSRSLQKAIKKHPPTFYINRDFDTVIKHCANIPRKDRGTWIHPEMIEAYTALFLAGHAFCLEVEVNDQLAGGIYGVKVGDVFCGESMFSLQSNGSKLAMYGLCQYMLQGGIKLLDCQIHNPHLESMGAQLISRKKFLAYLT